MAKPKTDVLDEPVVVSPTELIYVSPQTRAEQELGRATAEANAKTMASIEVQRAKEAEEKSELDAERDAATKAAVYPHAADGQVKP
jgi:hypothetical protein